VQLLLDGGNISPGRTWEKKKENNCNVCTKALAIHSLINTERIVFYIQSMRRVSGAVITYNIAYPKFRKSLLNKELESVL
jgi:hypothetical protein